MQKNDILQGKVVSFASEGEGVIKQDGYTAFVPFCLPEEEVSFKALKVKGDVVFGKIEQILTPSSQRVQPKCPHFGKCGGCQLQHLAYEGQLEFKREQVQNCLKKLGGIDAQVQNTVPSAKVFGYRNKLALPVGVDENGNTVVGMYAPRSHRIIALDDCPIQADWCKKIISAVYEYVKATGLKGFDEIKKTGQIRHVVAREVGGNYVITLVTTKKVKVDAFVNVLKDKFASFTLIQNINDGDGNAILGKQFFVEYGSGFFVAQDCGIKFKAGASTFLQINDGVRTLLYKTVIENLATDGNSLKETVAFDLYSGGGMLTAMLANVCKKAYGIEVVKEAVQCADELTEMNGLSGKMVNVCAKVEDKLPAVMQEIKGDKRVIVCDPPRKGMERSVIRAILQSGAQRVVLVSCNPATLARDLGMLCGSLVEKDGQLVKPPDYTLGKTEGFYSIEKVIPFDMFPQTKHVETLVCLTKEK